MKRFTFIMFSILFTLPTIGQDNEIWKRREAPDTLIAKKTKCNCDLKGYKIKILEHKSEIKYKWSKWDLCNYTYAQLYDAEIKLKIRVIEQLLKFESDTSKVCMKVKPYWTKIADSLNTIDISTYPICVDALYHINFILFGVYAGYYAPFPVLYDTLTNKEINNDIESIREVFSIYKEWIIQCKNNGFREYSFPLLTTRYKWRFGHTDDVKMKEIPIVRGPMLKSIGKPRE